MPMCPGNLKKERHNMYQFQNLYDVKPFFFLSLRILLCECLIKHEKECWNNSRSYEGRNNLRKFGEVSRILNRHEERAKGRRQGGKELASGKADQ